MVTNLRTMKCGRNNRVVGLTRLQNKGNDWTFNSFRQKKVVVITRGPRLI